MKAWAPLFSRCTHVFIQAPGTNRLQFVGKSGTFSTDDIRVQGIPFTTGRPTLSEIRRVRDVLAFVSAVTADGSECACSIPKSDAQTFDGLFSELCKIMSSHQDGIKEACAKLLAPLPPHINTKHLTQTLLCWICECGSVSQLKQLVVFVKDICSLNEKIEVHEGRTCLHVASMHDNQEVVTFLLENGVDPTLRDDFGHTAYDVAQDKSTRMIFRQFATSHAEQFNFAAAGIPAMPLSRKNTPPPEKKNKKKKKSKSKKVQNVIIDDDEPEQPLLVEPVAKPKTPPQAPLPKIQLPQPSGIICSFCKKGIVGVPFERLDFKYCSTACVAAHRRALS